MKDILKVTAGTLLAFVICGVFFTVMTILMIAGLAATDSTPSLEDKSVLHLKLNGALTERSSDENPLNLIMGGSDEAGLSLVDVKKALKLAAANDEIKGVYLDCFVLSADFAMAQELRQALVDFKKSGKFIIAYGEGYDQGCYYVASVADKIMLNPNGLVDWHGIASQPIFYKELADKLGVKFEVFKVGTYKSAVEPFIMTEMSAANREQVTSYIGSIWKNLVKDVAQSRKLSEDTLNGYADKNIVALLETPEFLKMKLVDTLCYADGAREVLHRMAKVDADEEVNLISASDLASMMDEPSDASDKVAVYYASGEIVDAAAADVMGLQGEELIVGSEVVEDLDELAKDDDVKAVVLRINSPGGSANASEQIWHAIQVLKTKKPVVVSMSGMAASGGYYMSCGANYIFAEPTTITGSIGIFGLIPDFSNFLTQKLGLHFDVVKTNESSDFGADGRSFNAMESAAMQNYVNAGYKQFISRVAAGRKMTLEQVDSIGQGRVWTGEQAIANKLVDKLGTLEDAVAYAAKLAKLKDYDTADYPEPSDWLTDLLDQTTGDDYVGRKMQAILGEWYKPLIVLRQVETGHYLMARIPYEPNFK